MPQVIITGGAGFIGSAVVAELNARGFKDVLIVDTFDRDKRSRNLAGLGGARLMDGGKFRGRLAQGYFDPHRVEAVIHLAAIVDLAEKNWRLLEDVNVAFSQEIIRWCFDNKVRCVYASSGSVYGDGGLGYSDDHGIFDFLKPLNMYGRSKLLTDIWARDSGYLEAVAGLRYFNVFGPGGRRRSDFVASAFEQVQRQGVIELFASSSSDYGHGEQRRDFIYIRDVVDATLFFLENRQAAGVFNVGTGEARSWNDVARAVFAAMGRESDIRYVPAPKGLAVQTTDIVQADISKLRGAGYSGKMMSLEEAIADYVKRYLIKKRR